MAAGNGNPVAPKPQQLVRVRKSAAVLRAGELLQCEVTAMTDRELMEETLLRLRELDRREP